MVSIIIPCYNQAQYLEEAVESAVDQTYPNIEIIIINDGSTDTSEEVALKLQEKHPNIIQIISQKNKGVSEARNNGIQQSRGKYILPFDGDDILYKDAISLTLTAMIEYKVDIVSPNAQSFGMRTNLIIPVSFPHCNLLYANCWVGTSLYKKEVWQIIGGYKSNMNVGYEDWEFWINAYKFGFHFHHLSNTLFQYRTKNISRDTLAVKKDTYIKAKITMNNPELYTTNWVQKAINTIRKDEASADLYFYSFENTSIDKRFLSTAINRYLTSNQLQERQLITIPDTSNKVILYSLNTVKNHKQLKQLYEETEADFTLFYSSLRYEVPSLQNLDFAWDKDKGIIDTSGTVFPFVFKPQREDNKLQLIAYQRELKYLKYKSAIDAESAKKKLDSLQHKYNLDAGTTQKKLDTIANKYNLIMKSISKLIRVPAKTKPLQKISAYKSLTKTYLKLRNAENEKK